jgi:hypothetical protein
MHKYTYALCAISLVIGVMSIWIGLSIQSDIYDAQAGSCGKTVQKVTTGVTILGTMMIVATLALIICDATCCGRCPGKMCDTNYESGVADSDLILYYTIFVFLLSIVLTTLGAILHNYVKESDNACTKIKSKANHLLWTGIIGILLTSGPTVYTAMKHHAEQFREDRKDRRAVHVKGEKGATAKKKVDVSFAKKNDSPKRSSA